MLSQKSENTFSADGSAVSKGDSVWLLALEEIRAKSPATFDQWFAGIQYEGLIDGVLSLRARDEFVRDWVDDHFVPALASVIRRETDWSVRVAWSIGGTIDQPVATRRDEDIRAKTLRHEMIRHEMIRTAASQNPLPASRTEGLSEKYTFSNFVVGPSNQLAHAASIAAAGGGRRRHNPLFLCGGTGLGKTHLVHAVAHRVREENPNAKILYLSAEKFVNEFVQALQDQKMGEFRAKFRNCDLLLVDDIQFLANKTQTQEEFFHAFNALHQAEKQIVVTSDKYPQQLERMEERLVSRFQMGLVADMQAPELETRVAIIRKKALAEGIEIADEVVLLVATTIRSNVRELEGTMIRLVAKASLLGKVIDLEFARAELSLTTTRVSDMGPDDILRVVTHHFKLRSGDLQSKDRHKSLAYARHVAMYLCREHLQLSLPELGRIFGGRDHTTVMSGIRKVKALIESDPETRAHVDALKKKIWGDN